MGAGQYPAGLTPAGFDPVYVGPVPTPPFLPRAVYFDPSIKQHVLQDANGNNIDMHPVVQIVVQRGTAEQGDSASNKSFGNRLRALIQRQPAAKIPQLAYSEVERLYADLIEAGDILLLSVSANTDVRGRVFFAISFVNLRDPATNPRFPLPSSQTLNV